MIRPVLYFQALLASAAIVLVTGLVTSCAGPEIRVAPFRVRPDSVDAGDLRGPFTGKVFDATTRAPIAGALVYAAWSFQQGAGLPSAAGFHDFVGSTDASGNYTVPGIDAVPDGARLTDFQLLVYKRGFVAYRSDRRFADLGPRMDFAQRDNQVLLERWRDDYSHVRHLRYVGGGAAVAALTGWEAEEAAAELAGAPKRPGSMGSDLTITTGRGPYLVAAQLLSDTDIKAQTKFDGGFETGPLGDEPDTTTYSSQHFKALGRPETFDVALRMWRLDPGEAQTRYEELLASLPSAEEKNEIASRSLRATEGDIQGVAFFDGQRGVVVLLTCGKSQCASLEDAVTLATKIYDRIKALWPTPGLPGATP